MSAEPADPRPVVLVLLGVFCRDIEATGPRQSMINMAHSLSSRFRFRVIGWGSRNDVPDRWSMLEGIEFLPLQRWRYGVRRLGRAIRATPHDLLVMNSFFDKQFSLPALLMRRFGLLPRAPALLAPRGEFSPGALTIGRRRKRLYTRLARALGLLDGVSLQVTSQSEAEEARAALPFFRGPICVTPNIRTLPALPPHSPRGEGEPLRVAFLSRIDRKKNLHFALDVLARGTTPVEFAIFGPATDEAYWRRCEELARTMPAHVTVRDRRVLSPGDVLAALAGQDLFFLPTLGENYGHAIIDSLLAGTPVLISDQTPWRGLEARRAGWDLPLGDPAPFAAALAAMAAAGPAERRALRIGARAYGEAALDTARTIQMTAACFDGLIGERPGVRAVTAGAL